MKAKKFFISHVTTA